MNTLNIIYKYYLDELSKIDQKLYNLFDTKEKQEKFKKYEEKLYTKLNNPKNKNIYSLLIFNFFLKSVWISSNKDAVFDLTEEKVYFFLQKEIIEDLLNEKSTNIFMALDFINELMHYLNLTITEKLDVYNYIINKNIKNKISKNKVYKLDLDKIHDKNNYDLLKILFYLPNKEKYLKKKYLTKSYNNKINEMNNAKVLAENEVKAHEVFALAFNKENKEDYDINNIIDSLKIFNFNETDIQKVKKHYEKINENKKKEKIKINIDFNSYQKMEEEKNNLRNELSKYLDKKDKLIKFLEYEDLKKLVNILIKLDYDKDFIRKIINENELKLKSHDLTCKYNYYIELMEVYAEKCGFLKELEELNNSYKKGIILNDNMSLILRYVPSMSEHLLK